MKRLQEGRQAAGHHTVHLVDPEDVGQPHFEETGESPEGMDFAVLWNGTGCQGRCFASFPDSTFVTFQNAQRLLVYPGLQARLPHTNSLSSSYRNWPARLCKSWETSPRGKAAAPTQTRPSLPGKARGWQSRWSTGGRTPVALTITLDSSGDILLGRRERNGPHVWTWCRGHGEGTAAALHQLPALPCRLRGLSSSRMSQGPVLPARYQAARYARQTALLGKSELMRASIRALR